MNEAKTAVALSKTLLSFTFANIKPSYIVQIIFYILNIECILTFTFLHTLYSIVLQNMLLYVSESNQ